MGSVNTELESYVNDKQSLFRRYYRGALWNGMSRSERVCIANAYDEGFHKLFHSLNPEVRYHALNSLSEVVFARAHAWPEALYFRRVVLNRELRAHMRYERYRDHTMHSFTTFLLGAFLYEHSAKVRSSLQANTIQQLMQDSLSYYSTRALAEFAFAMQDLFVSTFFHDIGYIFEGSHHAEDLWRGEGHLDLFRAGMAISDFYLREWPRHFLKNDIALAHEMYAVLPPPRIDTLSISAAARSLRTVPTISPGDRRSVVYEDAFLLFRKRAGLNGSALTRWEQVIDSMEYAFNQILSEGYPGTAIQMFDHGIVTGLLLLQLSNYYFEVERAVFDENAFLLNERLKTTLRKSIRGIVGNWDGKCWEEAYQASVRRICGAAFHNVEPDWWDKVWKRGSRRRSSGHPFPLRASVEGVLFVPMLLDTLQEWDRPSYPLRLKRTLVDGLDVDCRVLRNPERVRFTYGGPDNKRVVAKIRGRLNSSLASWREMVEVTSE